MKQYPILTKLNEVWKSHPSLCWFLLDQYIFYMLFGFVAYGTYKAVTKTYKANENVVRPRSR